MNKAVGEPVCIFEGSQTVAEQALASEAVLMAPDDVLETAVREHSRLVYRVAYSVLRNHHDAEDATQEVFIRVFRYRRKLDDLRDLKTWLARIAWRVAIDYSKKRPEVFTSETEVKKAIEQIGSQLVSAEASMVQKEEVDLLASLIAALPRQLRDALRLSTVEELTPPEIAGVLGTSEASVRSRLFRARRIVKEKLAALEGNYGTPR